jgi:flagellar protein FliL
VSDASVSDDFDVENEEDFVPGKKKLSGKKIVMFFVLPLLLLSGSVTGMMVAGVFGGGTAPAAQVQPILPSTQTVFFDLPEMLVNLNTPGRRPTFLKMQVSLELENANDIERLRTLSPRIIDNFQVYLRELRIEDLRGSAGVYRLREELLARVNTAVHPARVKDVLFKEMLVQ